MPAVRHQLVYDRERAVDFSRPVFMSNRWSGSFILHGRHSTTPRHLPFQRVTRRAVITRVPIIIHITINCNYTRVGTGNISQYTRSVDFVYAGALISGTHNVTGFAA